MKTISKKPVIRKKSIRKSSGKGQIIIIILLFLLLPLLAVMQYIWLGQLSDAELIRLQSNLELSAKHFADDFDNELTRIHQQFSIDNSETDLGLQVQQVYNNWIQNAALPDLIEDIYYLKFTDSKINLSKFITESGSFISTPWPDHLNELKKYLPDTSEMIVPMLLALTHAPLLGEVPMVISECISCRNQTSRLNNILNMGFEYLVIVLDKNVLNRQFIATLSGTFFPQNQDTKFDLAIASTGDSLSVFYTSDSSVTEKTIMESDIKTDIGRWRSSKFLIAQASIIETDTKITKVRKKSATPRLSIEVIKTDTVEESNFYKFMIAKNKSWYLFVKYHEDSLSGVVTQSRIRNLVISYGILLILGISIYLVYSSSRRAKKLADKQVKFVAGVSHELRTPLAVIRSAAENLADGVVTDSNQLKKYGEIIHNEGRRLTAMIEQTLTYSGIQNENYRHDFKLCSLEHILEESLREIKNLYFSNIPEIKLSSNSRDKSNRILADSDALKKAFINIINNAIKYSSDKSPVIISVKENLKSGGFIIDFEDSGRGIKSEELPYIFEPFYRGSNNDAGQIAGSGLGLSLVKEIIELHHGNVTVKSTPGSGSVFTVRLPIAGSEVHTGDNLINEK